MRPKISQVVHLECPHYSDHSDPNPIYFWKNLGTLQTHFRETAKLGIFWMCLQCSQIFPKIYRVGITVVWMMGKFQMYHLGNFWSHHSGAFWILLTRNTAIKLMGTLQGTLWMSHSGTSQVLSLGKFKMYPLLSYLGHPGHMTWYTVNVLAVFCEWATQAHCSIFFGKI